jgi:hypothetical protein
MRGGQPGAFGKGGHNPWQRGGSYNRPSYQSQSTHSARQQQYETLEIGQKIRVESTSLSNNQDSLTTVVGRTQDNRSVRIFIDMDASMKPGWSGEVEIYRIGNTPGIYSARPVARTAQAAPAQQAYRPQPPAPSARPASPPATLDVTVSQPARQSPPQAQKQTIAFSDLTGVSQDSALIYVPPQALEMLVLAGLNYVIMQGQAVDGNATRIQSALQTHVRSGKPLYQIEERSPDLSLTLGQYLSKHQQGMEVDVGEKTLEAPAQPKTAEPAKMQEQPKSKPAVPADIEVLPKHAPIPQPRREQSRQIVRAAPAVHVSSRPGGGSGYTLEHLL